MCCRGLSAIRGSNTPRPRLPITSNIKRALKRGWEMNGASFNNVMLWAAACCCFFGFPQSGEATIPSQSAYDPSVHLSLADVSLDLQTNPQIVSLRIKTSKTDQFRIGVNICLGRTNNDLCPVAAVLSYISRRGTTDGPLFHFENGSPLTRNAFVKEIRSALRLAGVDAGQYAGHSFRIDAATSAAAAGLEDAVIKILGGRVLRTSNTDSYPGSRWLQFHHFLQPNPNCHLSSYHLLILSCYNTIWSLSRPSVPSTSLRTLAAWRGHNERVHG